MQTKCPKCLGTGNLPRLAHLERGRCFRCSGSGQIVVDMREFVKIHRDADTRNKVRWMAEVPAEVIDRLTLEKLETIENFASAPCFANRRDEFVYGLFLEKFAEVLDRKRDEVMADLPKPF